MLLQKVCQRAGESIIDELVVVAMSEKYPKNFSVLVDALIALFDFDYMENRTKYNHDIPDDFVVGRGLVFNLLAATSMTLEYGNLEYQAKFEKLLIHICSINSRFKAAFINFAYSDEDGPESCRFELGDMAVDSCKFVMQSIN